jgi:HEAT repeat protein
VRLSALSGLDALGASIAWERLAPLLDDPTLRPLALALTAAALSDSPEAVRVLVQALSDARGETFGKALSSLGRLSRGPLHDEVRRALRGSELAARLPALALDPGLSNDRRATALTLAATALASGAAAAAQRCLAEELLADTARRALLVIGASALPTLIAAVSDGEGEPETRAELIRVLAEIVEENPEIEGDPALLTALRAAACDAEPRVAVSALGALARLGTADDLETVAELTLSESRALALAAADALAELCLQNPEAARAHAELLARDGARFLPAVIELGALAASGLCDPGTPLFLAQVAATGNTAARRAAVLAAAELDVPLTLEVLRIALTDEEHEVQLAAARAIGHRVAGALSTSTSPAELLDPVEHAGEVDLLAAAVRAIGERIGLAHAERRSAPPPAPELLALLAHHAQSALSPVALAAVDALGQASSFGAAPARALASALEHPESSVARAAAFKLSETPAGQEALIDALAHPTPAVRVLVAEMLLDTDLPDARERLVRHAAIEGDAAVREAIELAIDSAARSSDGAPLSRHGGSSRPPGEGRL